MNKNKRILIIAAIILNLITGGLYIGILVNYLVVNGGVPEGEGLYFAYEVFGVVGYFVSAGLLWYSVAKGGRCFRERQIYYYAAFIINVCLLGTFSIATILLFITLFMSDIVYITPHDDVYFRKEEPQDQEKEARAKQIEHLRQLRDEGKITEEEFQAELLKLL